MKFFALFLVVVLGFMSANAYEKVKNFKAADKEVLNKQKKVYDLLNHMNQHNYNEEQVKIAHEWKLEEHEEYFSKPEVVKDFMRFYQKGFLPKYKIFTLTYDQYRDEAIALFHVFYYAKDFETFYKTACWAREHMNEGLFVYSFTVAVIHRTDCQGIVLPAPYEIYPFYFVSSDVMDKVNYVKTQGHLMDKELAHQEGIYETDKHVYAIHNNFSVAYDYNDVEQQLSYFTNDIGLNTYYYYFHIDYPFWMAGQDFGLNKDRRGELYYYVHQQLMARYYLERLSNGLGEIPRFSWYLPVKTGFNPNMKYHNGHAMPMRSQDFVLDNEYNVYHLQEVEDYERRIRTAINLGFITLYDGRKLSLKNYEDIESLGRFVQGNEDLGDIKFYDYLSVISKFLLGGAINTHKEANYVPSAIEQFQTTMRDPMFYQLYTRFMRYFFHFKDHLPTYTKNDLYFEGVKVENVAFTPLTTYMEPFDFDITTGSIQNQEEIEAKKEKYVFYARQYRLNHKTFSTSYDITSAKDSKVSIRVFLGPKYDEFGRHISLDDNKYNFVELDYFIYNLKSGKNAITRDHNDFIRTVDDSTHTRTSYEKVMNALSGKGEFYLDQSEAHNGWPRRLLLPKGRVGGMKFQVYVIVTPFDEAKVPYGTGYPYQYTAGIGSGARYYENKPFGYPLDRTVDEAHFYYPNMFWSDVTIYHSHDYATHNIAGEYVHQH